MKDKFFDYTIYSFDDQKEALVAASERSEFDKDFLVLCQKFREVSYSVKVAQILGSVKLHDGMYQMSHHDLDKSIISNALTDEKVTRILIFDNQSDIPEISEYNQVIKINHTEVLRTYSLSSILAEEQSGETQLRRSLWAALKQWLL